MFGDTGLSQNTANITAAIISNNPNVIRIQAHVGPSQLVSDPEVAYPHIPNPKATIDTDMRTILAITVDLMVSYCFSTLIELSTLQITPITTVGIVFPFHGWYIHSPGIR